MEHDERDVVSMPKARRQLERARLAMQHGELMHDLKSLQPWRCAVQIGMQWLIVGAAITLALRCDRPGVTFIALVIIATRQHALLVLMHDAAHYLISRSKWRNDLVAGFLLTFPLTISTSRYRAHHLAHHRHLNSAADPDYDDAFAPANRRQLWMALLRDISGLSTLQSLRSMDSFGVFGLFQERSMINRTERYAFLVFVAVAGITLSFTHVWLNALLFWLVPMIFFLPPILRIRSLSEHAGRSTEPVTRDARSVAPGLLERLTFAPCNINHHWEHHLFPQVPSYRLRILSKRLAARLPDTAAAQPTRGYLIGRASMLAELYSPQHLAHPVAHHE